MALISKDGGKIIGTEFCADGNQDPNSVILTESGEIVITGIVTKQGNSDVFFMRLNLSEFER